MPSFEPRYIEIINYDFDEDGNIDQDAPLISHWVIDKHNLLISFSFPSQQYDPRIGAPWRGASAPFFVTHFGGADDKSCGSHHNVRWRN